jgi:transcription initiation factor TFIIIB Brf1 subunit/transcription initiation factor TFIIB
MEEDFSLFDELFSELYSNNSSPLYTSDDECKHLETVKESDSVICIDCGMEITKNLIYEKDWRYYGYNDSRKGADPNRCHIRKPEEKTIYKDVEHVGFSDKITNMANDIYSQVTKGKIYRGNSRKAIVFACIFHAYKISGKPQSCDSLRKIFNLERKTVLKGLKHVSLNAPKNSAVRTKYITPVELVEELMDRFGTTKEQKNEVIDLYTKIRNKSSILNRSRPQSVASSLIYYYLSTSSTSNIEPFNIKDFIKKVELSELTVNKISKEISRVLSCI